jgi:hypothetical protein
MTKTRQLAKTLNDRPRMVFGIMCHGDNSPAAQQERQNAYTAWKSQQPPSMVEVMEYVACCTRNGVQA